MKIIPKPVTEFPVMVEWMMELSLWLLIMSITPPDSLAELPVKLESFTLKVLLLSTRIARALLAWFCVNSHRV
jgi:hypothetical protein